MNNPDGYDILGVGLVGSLTAVAVWLMFHGKMGDVVSAVALYARL